MLGCWSQPQARNITRNMYTMSGEGGRSMGKCSQHEKRCLQHGKKCSQHGKRCSQHDKSFRNIGKGVRNIRNTLCNITIRRLICFLIRIVWLGRCPMLAPRSDVRVLAVAYRKTQNVWHYRSGYSITCGGKLQASWWRQNWALIRSCTWKQRHR
jgi:hypothetical protein